MYLDHIYIENTGPIERFDFRLAFRADGTPKPTLLVGENGKGKTVLLSTIADSLHEFASQSFQDVLPQYGAGHSYFKITGARTLRAGSPHGFSFLRYQHGMRHLEYIDKAGNVSFQDVSKKTGGELTLANGWQDDGNVKTVTHAPDVFSDTLRTGTYCFFPAHRFETPHWLNSEAAVLPKTFLSTTHFADKLQKPIVIASSLADTQQWLLSVAFDNFLFERQIPNLAQDWKNANKILQIVLGNPDASFGFTFRLSDQRLSIGTRASDGTWTSTIAPSLSHLSAGQVVLLNLFLTILRYSDARNDRDISTCTGIVVVDEIDLHLHTNLQRDALPALLKLFPSVQFILTTHSPVFLLAMRSHFADDEFNIVELPNATILNAEQFKEFADAFKTFRDTRAFDAALKDALAEAQTPIVFVEGSTDVRHIKRALEVLGKANLLDRIEIKEIGEISSSGSRFSGKDALNHTRNFLHANPTYATRRTMLLYDSDANKAGEAFHNVLIRCYERSDENKKVKVGVENLYPAAIIDRRFYVSRESTTEMGERKIIESFDKVKFCDYVCADEHQIKAEHFSNFEQIAVLLEELIS